MNFEVPHTFTTTGTMLWAGNSTFERQIQPWATADPDMTKLNGTTSLGLLVNASDALKWKRRPLDINITGQYAICQILP